MKVTIPNKSNYREYRGWSIEGIKLRQLALDKKICAYCKEPLDNNYVKYWCSINTGKECSYKFHMEYYIDWNIYRFNALERDNNKCVFCKQPAKDVHHIIPIAKGGDVFDLDNLISLCSNCHKHTHKNINMILIIPDSFIRNKQISDYLES